MKLLTIRWFQAKVLLKVGLRPAGRMSGGGGGGDFAKFYKGGGGGHPPPPPPPPPPHFANFHTGRGLRPELQPLTVSYTMHF